MTSDDYHHDYYALLPRTIAHSWLLIIARLLYIGRPPCYDAPLLPPARTTVRGGCVVVATHY